MTAPLLLSRSGKSLHHAGTRFDPWFLAWRPAESPPPADAVPVDPAEALGWACREGGARRLPVGVIGPRQATTAQLATAEAVGRRLAELGVPMVCGGRGGVMEAASKGCWEAGGITIGILPDEHWNTANAYVAIPLATGLNEARNVLIARASAALIAVGGSHGTLTEIAFGVHFGRPVLLLEDAWEVPGAVRCATVEEAVTGAARALLGLPPEAATAAGAR